MHAMEPDDLYGLPLDRFIPERTALTRALRADKRRDEAAAVAALRKPSVAAWAVNQLVRTQGAAVQELYEAGDALRTAQSELLTGGGDGRALRAANDRERAAVDGLVQTARGLLDSGGHELSAIVIERVGDTLHAAALDEQAREQVRGGRLERELRHVGLGIGESLFAASPPPAAPQEAAPKRKAKAADEPQETKAQRTERERREREEKAAATQAERERAEARKAARAAEAAARRRAERSLHALRAAEERRARADQALADADAALAAARAEAEEAAAAQRRAQEELRGR